MNAADAAILATAAWLTIAVITAAIAAVALTGAVEALWTRPARRIRSLGGQVIAIGRARVPQLLDDAPRTDWPRQDWRPES